MDTRKKWQLGFYITYITFFAGCLVYGVLSYFVTTPISGAQSTLVVLESAVAIVTIFIPILLEKWFRFHLAFQITVFWGFYLFLCVFLGEVFQFYYNVFFWDRLLHVMSAIFLTMIGFMLVNYMFRPRKKGSAHLKMALFACFFALACGAIWEILEFSIDQMMGTNLQKFIPETSELWNGGNTFDDLNGTDEQIAEFFRTPEGYKYALMDTMEDSLCNLFGVLLGLSYCIFKYKRDNGYFFKLFNKQNPRRKPTESAVEIIVPTTQIAPADTPTSEISTPKTATRRAPEQAASQDSSVADSTKKATPSKAKTTPHTKTGKKAAISQKSAHKVPDAQFSAPESKKADTFSADDTAK